jgi:hemerythrin-like domain-containing protein
MYEEQASQLAGGHHHCEDSWYSCPLSQEGCSDDRQPSATCNCGHDDRASEIAKALEDVYRRGWDDRGMIMR